MSVPITEEKKDGTGPILKDALLLAFGIALVIPGWMIGNIALMQGLLGHEGAYFYYVLLQALALSGFVLLAYPGRFPLKHLAGAVLAIIYLINLNIVRWYMVPEMREMAKDFEEQERETGEQPQMAGGIDPDLDVINKFDTILLTMILLLAVMAVLMFLLYIHRSRKLKKAREPPAPDREGRPPRKIRR